MMNRSEKRGHATQPSALFLPLADASTTQSIVISPPPLPREYERQESREDRQRTPQKPLSIRKKSAVRSHQPWPVLTKGNHEKVGKTATAKIAVAFSLERERRVYGKAENKVKIRKGLRTPRELAALDPLTSMKTQHSSITRQQQVLVEAMDRRIDYASQQLPLQFLLERQQGHVFAERVVLLAMCRTLTGHYQRIKRAAFSVWLKRTVTQRVLEQHTRKLFILRQSSLAHACAIIQRRIQARLKSIISVWKAETERLRHAEQDASCHQIQKCWRAWRMQRKLRQLALLYRERVRDESATRIQRMVRQYLARCEMARVVWLHHRHIAASRIQKAYRRHLVAQIAFRRRQFVQSIEIQRVWRGIRGRKRVARRRSACSEAATAVYTGNWLSAAIANAMSKNRRARQIQACWRAWKYYQSICHGVQRFHQRRCFFPAVRIQRTWRVYRMAQLQLVLHRIVLRVMMLHLTAARRIQQCFRVHWAAKTDRASRRITRLFRMFQAKRTVVQTAITPRLVMFQTQSLTRYGATCALYPQSRWTGPIQVLMQLVDGYITAQQSSIQRLHVRHGLSLVSQLQDFDRGFLHALAAIIQRYWRWFKLRRLVARLRQATLILQRALPLIVRQCKFRQRRRRVLQRWKRLRYVALHERFHHWKQQYLLAVEARELSTSTHKLRKALWFHHHKLRKRMMEHWWVFVLQRRVQHSKWRRAVALEQRVATRRHWRAWRLEALPFLCCRNRLRELSVLIVQWAVWRAFVQRSKQTRRAKSHHNRVLKTHAVAAWRDDRLEFQQQLVVASKFQDSHTSRRVFTALVRYVAKMKAVRAFSTQKQQSYALRHWFEHVYVAQLWRHHTASALAMHRRHLTTQVWKQWTRYRRHQLRQRELLVAMDKHYAQSRLKKIVHAWATALVPMWKDEHFITSVASMYRSRRLKERYFREGCSRFWAITAGARRIAMAIRIQRSYRRIRAQRKLFVMRTKVKYQLETRGTTGKDVATAISTAALQDALQEYQWVVLLLSFPWAPVDAKSSEAFSKTATTWRFIREQKRSILFATADPTEQFTNGDHAGFSMMSWFGLEPRQLPCVVAFWQGVGPGIQLTDDIVTARLGSGQIRLLKRRFKCVCTSEAMVFQRHSTGDREPLKMTKLVAWIESIRGQAVAATAVDLQSYARGFLARRRCRRLRALRKQRCTERICLWICKLKRQWIHNKRAKAATKIQTWVRHVYQRRLFWIAFRREMKQAQAAILTLQRSIRRRLVRELIRLALKSLVATADKYPNAPLCQECCHQSTVNEDDDDPTVEQRLPVFTLASVRCRDCKQVFCGDCFVKTHKSGKRLLHLTDAIDFPVINVPDAKMCSACEVRGATRGCRTCSGGGASDVEGSAVAVVATCLSCFELAHTDRRRVLDPQQRPLTWWTSPAFQQHQWHHLSHSQPPVEEPTNAPTATAVMEKYGWTSKNAVLWRQQQRQQQKQQTQISQRERDAKLLAIRVQQEAILRDAFDRFDADKSGAIDRHEFQRMFKEELCEPLSDAQVDEAMAFMDKSGNGLIEFDELLAWFAEDALAKSERGADATQDPRSLARLKDALRAKRQMRRYKEKLNEFLPSVDKLLPPVSATAALSQWGDTVLKQLQKPPKKPTVPGFPSVECLEHSDFAAKRTVFFRFIQEIGGLEWILEDAETIPVTDAMQVFDRVFVPRWNAGELTYDFYFDDERFEFEGEEWQRRWDPGTKKYCFTTTRKMLRTLDPESTTGTGKKKTKAKKKTKNGDASSGKIQVEETIEIVEAIDPRRKQLLLAEAQAAFARADADGSGFIDEHEFHRMLTHELCEPVSKSRARQVMKQLDADGSGKIDFHEFFQWYAVEKCQDYPVSASMERTRALLKTRRRAAASVTAAMQASVAGGVHLTQAIAARRRQQQLEKDCKGASRELIELLQDGHEKALAEKALALHNQDVAFARHWLQAKRDEEERERAQVAKDKAERKAQAKKDQRARDQRRRQKMKAMRQKIKFILVGQSKKEAHAARLQQALTNLDKELQLVERPLSDR